MSSSLRLRLTDSVKDAMRAHDAARVATLRFLMADVKQKEVDERRELSDADIVAIIEKQIKQRRESIAAFEKGGRTEKAESEKTELRTLQAFLPQQATEAEIEAAVDAAVAQLAAQGITGAPAMGKAMAQLKSALAGRADMAHVSTRVKQLLMGR